MNSTHMMINPNELVIDMPVDEGNVKLKMESLQSSGMVQPVTVWLQDLRIIDGFHRTEAAKRLGWSEISCNVIDCTEDAFWDARIQSAKQHHAIEAQRLEAWMLESWKATEWYVPDSENEFNLELAAAVWDSLYSQDRRTSDGIISVWLDDGCNPLLRWIEDKAQAWGMNRHQLIHLIIDRTLSRTLRDLMFKGLTFAQAWKASEMMKHKHPTGYSNVGFSAWVDSEIRTNKPQPLSIFDFDTKRIRQEKEQQQAARAQWEQTPQGQAAVEKQRAEARLSTLRYGVNAIKDNIESISHVVGSVPEAPAMLAELAQYLHDFIAQYLPQLETPDANPIALENAKLRKENDALRDRVASLERALQSQESAGALLAGAVAWSSTDLDR